jgi:RNA polymerase sigma-70 factor (ECF subfamily)
MVAEDLALAKKAASGDQDAFTAIYKGNYKSVYYHVADIVGDRGEAEDITQEVFLRAYQFMGSYSGDASLNRWLKKVATNFASISCASDAFPRWPGPQR